MGIFLGVVGLLLLAAWLITLPAIQQWLVNQSADYLSKKLQTKVQVAQFELGFFNRLHIGGVYIEDQQKDTLAYVGRLSIRTNELLGLATNSSNKAVIHSVELNDVWVYMKRGADTSRWNFDFIAEAFSSGSSSNKDTLTTKTPSKKSSGGPAIDLKQVDLANIHFFMDDAWRGEDYHVELEALQLKPKQFDLAHSHVAIASLLLDQPHVLYRNYEGGKPEDLTPDDTTEWGTPFNPDLFRFELNELTLKGASFQYENDTDKVRIGEFDEDHLRVKDINMVLKNTRLVADTLFSSIEHLSAHERCGLNIEAMRAEVKFSQIQAQLSNLYLKTNHSELRDYFELRYKNFHAFNEFIDQVTLHARLKHSKVSSLDVGYFAPILNEYPITIDVSGEAMGTIPNLVAPQIELAASTTYFKGKAQVVGLPDIDKTIFNVTAEPLRTSGADINKLIPQTKTNAIAWDQWKNIVYAGTYIGRAQDFTVKGKLLTNLGNADMNLSMNFYPKIPEYKGSFKADGLQLGVLLKQSDLGALNASGNIVGKGFDVSELNTRLDADIQGIRYAGTTYRNMKINGLFSNKKFDGLFVARDPLFNVDFNGKVDLSGKEPSYDFATQVVNVDLQKLGLVNEAMTMTCFARMEFTGNDIDQFRGSAHIKRLVLKTLDETYNADDIYLQALETGTEKIISLKSALADADLRGRFNMTELPNTVKMYLYHYLPDFIVKPAQDTRADFTFNVQLKEVDSLLQIFNRDFHHLNDIFITGALNTDQQHLSLDANIPSFGYKEFKLADFYLVSAGDFESFDLNANCGVVTYNNDVIIPSFQINSVMADDTASLSLISQSINDLLGEASLNVKATAFDDRLFVNLLPSTISIKNDRWELFSNHDVVIGDDIRIQDFRIQSGEQFISINSKAPAHQDIVVDFKQLDLEGASTYLGLDDIKIHGRLTGKLNLLRYTEKPELQLQCFSEKEIFINETELGKLFIDAQYNVEDQTLEVIDNTRILRQGNEAIVFGRVNLKDSLIDMQAKADQLPIDAVGEFLDEYIQGLQGAASGRLTVNGNLGNPHIAGNLLVKDLALKVLFLGTRYTSPEASFVFDDRKISMKDMTLVDERGSTFKAFVRGAITHHNFSDMYLDFSIKSLNFLCLNTNQFTGDLFYGFVPSRLDAKLSGYLDDITADIDARPLKGTKFYLPINSSGDASTYDYVTFAKVGKSQEEEEDGTPNYFKLNMNIDATPDAMAYIVLDENTGEEIIAQGNGALKLNLDLGNSLNMFGTYEITEGKYLFNFRGLIPREFAIDEKSKITWNGDAFDALMDVKALYRLPKPLPLYPLVSAQASSLDESDLTEAKRSYATLISLFLKGSLSTPDIKFDITQPDNRAVGTTAYTRLEQIRNNEQELITQSGILLLLGEFKASDGLAGSMSNRNYMSTVSDMVSGAVSSEVTNLIQKLTGLNTISVNLGYKSTGIESQSTTRNEFKVNVSTRLLNDRIVVDFGNSVDVSKDQTGKATGSLMSGDFKAQFLISEDGRFRANAYRTNSMDVDGENYTKSGAGLSYRKVFNKFSDLFVNSRKKARKSNKQDSVLQDAS